MFSGVSVVCRAFTVYVRPRLEPAQTVLFSARYYASAVLAIGLGLSLCLSQVGVLLKRLNVGSHKKTPHVTLVFWC